MRLVNGTEKLRKNLGNVQDDTELFASLPAGAKIVQKQNFRQSVGGFFS